MALFLLSLFRKHVVASATGAGFYPLPLFPPTHHQFHFWMVLFPEAGLETLHSYHFPSQIPPELTHLSFCNCHQISQLGR